MAKIVSKDADLAKIAEQAETALPAAGYKREDELAKRKDALQQAIEEKTEAAGLAGINPKSMDPDREILNEVSKGYLNIDMPGYKIQWVNCVNAHGQAVWDSKARGWVPVTVDMLKEVPFGMAKADGSLRVGDVMAMCIPVAKYNALIQVDRLRRLKRESGVMDAAKGLARSKQARGAFDISESANDVSLDKLAVQVLGNMMKK